jgi:hypothetical protein
MSYAAFSPDVKERNGKYITSWGRFVPPRSDIVAQVELGAKGNGYKVWDWCESTLIEHKLAV